MNKSFKVESQERLKLELRVSVKILNRALKTRLHNILQLRGHWAVVGIPRWLLNRVSNFKGSSLVWKKATKTRLDSLTFKITWFLASIW